MTRKLRIKISNKNKYKEKESGKTWCYRHRYRIGLVLLVGGIIIGGLGGWIQGGLIVPVPTSIELKQIEKEKRYRDLLDLVILKIRVKLALFKAAFLFKVINRKDAKGAKKLIDGIIYNKEEGIKMVLYSRLLYSVEAKENNGLEAVECWAYFESLEEEGGNKAVILINLFDVPKEGNDQEYSDQIDKLFSECVALLKKVEAARLKAVIVHMQFKDL